MTNCAHCLNLLQSWDIREESSLPNPYGKGEGEYKYFYTWFVYYLCLSYHDGEGKTVLRAKGIQADVDEIYLSIFGTIQPEIIKRLMGNGDDEDGQWARFFFVHQPLQPSYMDDDDAGGVNLHERMTAAYRNCFAVPRCEYKLSPEAFKLYVPFYNKLERLRVQHPSLGLRAIYSKAEGHTGDLGSTPSFGHGR